MYKKNSWVILFLTIITSSVFAQTATVEGTVRSQGNGSLLFGVTVVDENNNGTATDSTGQYILTLKPGKHIITFKFIGFTDKKASVELKDGEQRKMNVLMAEATSQLGTVVVSAGKFEQRIEDVTVSMEVIKPALVENRNSTSMDEILEQVPGVNIIDGQANIRGGAGWSSGAGSRVMVLVDDLPELTADASDAKWDFMPVENLNQVEVIKGASSALFGSSAIDGVINIRTAYPTDTLLTKVNIYGGIYDTPMPEELKWWGNNSRYISGASFFHSRKIKNLDLVIGGNYNNTNGYQQGAPYKHFRYNGNFRYRFPAIQGLSAGVNFNHIQSEGGLFFIWQNDSTGGLKPYGGLNPDSTTISVFKEYRTTIDPFITYVDDKGNSIKIRTRFFNSINDNNTNQSSDADFYYVEGQYQHHFNDEFTLTGGIVNSSSKVRSDLYGDHNGDNLAFYAQADAKWKRFTLSIGGRAEHYTIDDYSEKYTPVVRTGINYHVAKSTYLRASYGQGYRFPSIAEKYVRTQIGGAWVYPNPALQSEKGHSSEIGIKQGVGLGKWYCYLDVAAFQTEYNNMMEFEFSEWGDRQSSSFGLGFRSFNTGNTRIRGIDASISGAGTVIGKLKATILAGLTYMDPRQLSFNQSYINQLDTGVIAFFFGKNVFLGTDSSNFLKYRYSVLARVDLQLDYEKFSLGISFRYNSFMQNIDKVFAFKLLNNFTEEVVPNLPHYRSTHHSGDPVFDFRVGYRATKNLKASFLIKNALNREYMGRPGELQPPRSYTLQLAAAF